MLHASACPMRVHVCACECMPHACECACELVHVHDMQVHGYYSGMTSPPLPPGQGS